MTQSADTISNHPLPEERRKSHFSKLLQYVVPAIISVGLCWLLFTGIDFDEMMKIIRQECDFRWIALALALSILSHIFRAIRWGLQLRALDISTPFFPLLLSIFGTYAVNLVFPRLGEVWRTGYIAHRQHAKFSTVFGSMVADRLADLFTVALIAIITFILAAGPLTAYISGNKAAYTDLLAKLTSPWLYVPIIVFSVALWWLFRHMTKNAAIIKLRKAVQGLWNGFTIIFTMPRRGLWLTLTVCLWTCYFVQLWVAFYAFPFTAAIAGHDGVTAVLVTFVMSSILMGVPSNGGIGPWQWAVIFALGLYGLDRTPASAFANVVLGTQTLLIIASGIFTFAAIALDKSRITKKYRQESNIQE